MDQHPQARYIIDTLVQAGYTAYYAGGWVRDFLLGYPSDDIDIATNATPETIQCLFPKTVPIGLAFGIVLVIIDEHEYEVATFRNDFQYIDGRRPSRIAFSSPVEDAQRRDFTINGMFYNPITEEVLDYVNGKKDLEKKLIRAIGNPHERIKEDRLRMIRAIRLSCRFCFAIESETKQAILTHATELFPSVAIERVVQELEKAHKSKKLQQVLIQLHEYTLLPTIFPSLKHKSLEEVRSNLEPLAHFPHNAPFIAFLLPLFPFASFEEQLSICKYLKLSTKNSLFISVFSRAKTLCQTKSELIDWVYFYAEELSMFSLEILAALLPETDRSLFLKEHKQRMTFLDKEIERVLHKTPLIQAKDLLKEGILPGKTMGLLLKESERMVINQRISDKTEVIHLLKKTPLWPA